MSVVTLDLQKFRATLKAFASPACYPDSTITLFWDNATAYVSARNCGMLSGASRELALIYMTGHLLALNDQIAQGDTPGLIQSSTIDKVSVTLTPPPLTDAWEWWLMLTPYGAQLLALLQARSVGGVYVAGAPELGAFRRVGGGFWP